MNGTNKALEVFAAKEKKEMETLALKSMVDVKKALKEYVETSNRDEESQLELLLSAIRKYYETDSEKVMKNEEINKIMKGLKLSDAPAFMVKAIAETYNRDFRDLWEWFGLLKSEFDTVINSDFEIEKPLEYVLGLMEEARDNYYRIYTFSDFFEETLENLKDKRYQTVWKLYDEMLKEPKLMEAGDVIFVPEGPEYEHIGLHYSGEPPKRRLMKSWDMIDVEKRNNEARVTFRRYMALVANKELRKKVFGF